MNTSDMLPLAQRILDAPNNYARIGELLRLVPKDVLSQAGVQPTTSSFGAALGFSAVMVVGAAIGAGAALLLAPTGGKELRGRLRVQLDRMMAKTTAPGTAPHMVTPDATNAPSRPPDGKADNRSAHGQSHA